MNLNPKRLILSGLVFFLLAPFVFALRTTRVTPPQRRKTGAAARAGEPVFDLYRNNCARCHGADGRGDTPLGHTYVAPDFTDQAWWQKHSDITSDAKLTALVSHGKGGMPAFGKKLSRAEIRRLIGYVRRFKNQKPSD
jgi:mono/diheme cytochrome c family protein